MCSEAHQRDPRNANILRDRAEAYILNQEYEKGEKALTAANSSVFPCFVLMVFPLLAKFVWLAVRAGVS